MFTLDDQLSTAQIEDALPTGISAVVGTDRLSVQSLCSILCAILVGFSDLLERPIVAIIDNAQNIGPFNWVFLLELCKLWSQANLTFILPLRVLSTVDNLGSDNIVLDTNLKEQATESPFKFPMTAAEMTKLLIQSVSAGVDNTAQLLLNGNSQKNFRETEVDTRRRTIGRAMFSTNFTPPLETNVGGRNTSLSNC